MLHAFPNDAVVGEEDADVLRKDTATRELVWGLVRGAVEGSKEMTKEIGGVDAEQEMCALIDRGDSEGGRSGRGCFPFPL